MMTKEPFFILEQKLSYQLIGIFIRISKEHGFSYKEKVYQRLLIEELKKQGLKYISQPKIPIFIAGSDKILTYYYPDLLVEDKIIIEVKAQNQIFNTHINQLIKYLAVCKYEIGFIVNFGTPKAQILRRIYTNDRKHFTNSSQMAHPITRK